MRKINYLFLAVTLVIMAGLFYISGQHPNTVDPETYKPAVYSTIGALLPPVIAIALALITKEVYSSLFVGIAIGALLYSNGNLELGLNTMLYNENGGMITKLSDSGNVGIMVFLVILGIMVALMNKVGGSAAFGQWASKNIKTRVGAQLATIALGVLIFVDDYFNCLTVGSVMRPVTDRHQVSRAKLAYLIDATAAPICIIAPVSSWAAAVTSSVPKGLVLGSMATFFFTFCFYMVRNVMTFKEFTECIPAGFRAMVAPIMILTMAWTLSGMTGLLGAKFYVHDLVANSAGILKMFLPTIIFVVAMFLAFSTGTSWGTFSILIPVVCNVFGSGDTYEMLIISIAACLSGAVCGDHCSPISDTTIMASAGAHSDHVNHVSTQLPYALTAASVSVAGYLIAGGIAYFTENSLALIALPITLCLLFVTLLVMRTYMRKQAA